jgi:phytoene dehydrogenase-like protein
MSQTVDDPVLVVGGGIAGLMCASAIAGAGHAVKVLDAGGQLGGRAATTEHDGYLLNEGAHALYASSQRLLARAGVKVTGGHPRLHSGRLLRDGELLPAPFGPRALLGPGPLSARERVRLLSALTAATRSPARLVGRTCRSWVAQYSSTPAVEEVLGALLRLSSYCGDLEALPAEVGVGMLGGATRRPVRYIDGGWRAITAALASKAQGDGAQLRCGARVQGLLGGDGIVGVRLTSGEEHTASAVVLAGLSPTRAARLLSAVGGRLPASVAEPRPVRAACLDVALSELPRLDCGFVLGVDQPVYMSVHSLVAKLTPGGGAVVHLLRYDDGSEVSAEEVLRQLESLLDQAQPGWREHVVHRRFAPRMVVANHLPAPVEGLGARPAVRDTGLAGAFLAGDWVGPRGWLAGASMDSGTGAARAVIRELALQGSATGARMVAAQA